MAKVRTASDQEFWTAIQRLWTFEEPFSRWMRLRKNLAKIAFGSHRMDIGSSATRAEESLFSLVYGPKSNETLWKSIYMSMAIALREIACFQDQAFQYCLSKEEPSADQFWQTPLHAENSGAIENLISQIIEERKLSTAQAAYLTHSVRASPDWTRLIDEGPWAADARVNFVKAVFEVKDEEGDSHSPDIADGADSVAHENHLVPFHHLEASFISTALKLRHSLPASFFPKRILLVEGATEQILLPHFAGCLVEDWNERAVHVFPAGGASQLVRRYPSLRHMIMLPIDCVLDGDVSSQAYLVTTQLQDGDRLYVLESGAIEEAFPREQIVELVNAYFETSIVGAIFSPVTEQDLGTGSNQELLEKLWRKRNRGSFDKTGFARVIAESITTAPQIPSEIRDLINHICTY